MALPTPVVSQDKIIPVIPVVESHTVVTQIERLMEDFKLGKIDARTLNLQIMELWKGISIKATVVRPIYMRLLSINNEVVQKPTAKLLAYFLAPETIKNDIDDNQAQQLVELEANLSNIIASHLTNRGSKELLVSLLDLYESLLEHLWLLPCLVKDRGVYATIVENSSPVICARSEFWMNWLEKEAEKDRSLRSHFDGIKQAHPRISNPPQLDNEEMVNLQDSIRSPFFKNLLGYIYLKLGDYSRAIFHFEAYLISLKHRIDHLHQNSKDPNEIRQQQSDLGKIHGHLGSCYRALNNREQALQNHVRHLEVSQMLDDWDTEAQVCVNIGNVYFKPGHGHFSSNDDGDHALEWYSRGFKIAEQHNHVKLQSFYDTILELSELSLTLGMHFSEHLAKAKDYLNRALLGSQVIKNALLEAQVCSELGVLYGKKRNFDLAFEYTKRFLSIAVEKQSLALQGKAHGNLGIIYKLQGSYINAAKETGKQLAIAQESGDLITKGKAYVALGGIYKALKQDERANEDFEKHLAIVEQRYKDSINDASRGIDFRLMHEYSIACSNAGIMYFHNMQFDKAISCMQRILDVVKEIELRGFTLEPTILDIRSTANEILIKIYREIGSYELAIQKCNENLDNDLALEKISGTEKINKGSTYVNLAQIYVYKKEYEKAREQFQNALNVFERLKYENGIKLANCNLGAIYRIFPDFEKAKSCYGRAIEIAQRQQQGLKEKDEWKITLFEEQAYAYLGLEKVLLQEGNSHEALKVSESRRSRSLVEALKRRLVRGSMIDVDLTVNEIQEIAKQKNTTLVVYSAVPFDTGQLAVWVIAPSGSIEHKLLSIEPLQKDVQGFEGLLREMPFERTRGGEKISDITFLGLNQFDDTVRGDPLAVKLARKRFIKEKLDIWYQTLLLPIKDFLPQDPLQTVTIVPDSFLSQLPFAAFRDASDNKYLIEKHPISIAPSIHTLKILDEIALFRNTEQHSKQALIIGNPTLNDPKYAELAIGEQEAEGIAGLLNSKLLKRTEATVANFVQQASQTRWIFASCHGEANCKPDQDPYSVFEGQLKFSPDPEHSTGNLHSQLISTLDLKAELVFLSACYSGTGKVQQEGTIGNVWSFLSAGALSTVATYWPLKESETTKEMVNCFYKHMLGIEAPKLNKAQALQRAMILGMEKDRDNFSQWGAFFLSGLDE